MTTITNLNAFRQRHYLKLASSQGWDVTPERAEPLANVWIYSVHIDGTVRAAGQLLQSAVRDLFIKRSGIIRKKDIQLAGSAVDLLIEKPFDEEARRIALAALAHYFSRTMTAKLVPVEALRTGVHQVVIDWPAPDGKPGHILRPSVALLPTIMTPEQL